MAIKVHNGTAFADVIDVKVHNGTNWEDPKEVRVFNGTDWNKVWPTTVPVETLTTTWNVSGIWTYGGNTDSIWPEYKNAPIQGSYNGSKSTARRSILLFPYASIQTALAGATIEKVELYLKRLSSSHGASTAYACIKMHNYSAKRTAWDGTDLGNADSGSPSFTRGQARWIELKTFVGEKLRDGTIKGLCLDADTNYDLSRYIKYDDNIQLRITYSKEVA